jgi:putative ABC transport system permease protein
MMTEPARPAVSLRDRQPRAGPPSSACRRRYPRIDRFALTYLRRELRGRLRQALLIALGLGFGVGLVITVTAASAGVSDAQSTVLHSLYGIGTDLTVTKPASPANNRAGAAGGGGLQHRNALHSGSLELFPAASVSSVAHLAEVASAAGGLELSELTQAGGIPQAIPVEGIDVTRPQLGPLTSGTVSAGHSFTDTDNSADMAVLDANYAAASKLSVGSAITVAGTTFHVIGLVNQTQVSGATDIYIPLARAQALAESPAGQSLSGQVNVIYVAATTSSEIAAAQAEISRLLPAATVTDTSDLASEVSGSLGSAANLTNDLGRWAAAAALLAAFAVAGLLTTAAVNRRVRELGTLKALGWPAKRIVTQIMSESAATGTIGAALGIAIGFAGAALVDAIAPKLSATIPQQNGSGGTSTIAVHLAAHISPTAIAAAILLAIAGALIAGAAAARRAAQLQPADAFAQAG